MISKRVSKISSSGIRKFFDLVLGAEDVISLGVGEPDFITPWEIRESAIYAIEKGYTSYTSNYGLLELRKAISKYIYDKHGVSYNYEDEILITSGVSEAYDLAIRTITDPGDEIIVVEPSYVAYKPCIILVDGVAVSLPTSIENNFVPTYEEIEKKITDKTKAIVLNYPNNPTGAILNKKQMEEIADVVVNHDLILISDEIYEDLTYNGKHISFSSLNGMKDRTILLNGFSKAYAMTGWRVGYIASNKEIIEGAVKIHQYTSICAPIMSQMAAIEAITNGNNTKQEMIDEYNRRRRIIVGRLKEMGLNLSETKGAFYVFPSLNGYLGSEEFSERLLKEKKVAVVPGNAFGDCGEGFIRISYATSRKNLIDAADRISEFLNSLKE
ncbi:pyridoxal phosphate-dependent aminotransferase [Candidatus Methanoliparum sp. LAM-1]|uniref:pyridoxal phosphate-dependent aminotransferase n=1 Tax=Candidatus Methanoliparum sp. LAM-1 TaxID=2874846 RepID=UPI001E40509C|nr:aminotransferase class I/II-fold pyridoxal phosphate-dependent enzyme [Candidatus Methanoliparum sp. LAM-1]BDC36153.1 aromatic amino acid aminotransferase [Candidatus Methanoliparum sp. LAM-1]